MATNKEINKRLKELNGLFRSKYEETAARSWEDHVKTLPAGQPTPPKGKIYGETARDSFNEYCSNLRAEAADLIGQARKEVKNKMLEAPSADAVNVVNLLKLQEHPTREMVGDILGKYGDNYQIGKTISSIAHDRGIRGLTGASDELDQRMEALDRIEKSYGPSVFSVKGAEQGRTGGFMSLVESEIDSIFPAE